MPLITHEPHPTPVQLEVTAHAIVITIFIIFPSFSEEAPSSPEVEQPRMFYSKSKIVLPTDNINSNAIRSLHLLRDSNLRIPTPVPEGKVSKLRFKIFDNQCSHCLLDIEGDTTQNIRTSREIVSTFGAHLSNFPDYIAY